MMQEENTIPLDQITPLIVTFNESPNIGRLLAQLVWARRIVVVDSFSDDATETIARGFANVTFLQRVFDSHAHQWDFGLNHSGITTEWVLALDADYVLPEQFVGEIASLRPTADIAGYRASFGYCIHGKPLRGALYPPVTVLYRKAQTTYYQDGHTQRVRSGGKVDWLTSRLLHDDRKGLERWLLSQGRYMRLEAAKLLDTPLSELRLRDQVRRMIFIAPAATFFYCLIAKKGILDGRAGLYYALQRSVAEAILSLFMLERILSPRRSRRD